MTSIKGKITPEQALAIVERLCDRGGDVRDAVVAEAKALLSEFSLEETAEEVFDALDLIDIQDCRDLVRAHDDRISIEEAAADIVEEDLQPFFEQVERYHDLGMTAEEATYCQAVALGIHRFEAESEAVIKDLAADAPLECAASLLERWRERNPDRAAAMETFLKERCPKLAGK